VPLRYYTGFGDYDRGFNQSRINGGRTTIVVIMIKGSAIISISTRLSALTVQGLLFLYSTSSRDATMELVSIRVYNGISEGARDVAYVIMVSTDPRVYLGGVNATRAPSDVILSGGLSSEVASASPSVLDLGSSKPTMRTAFRRAFLEF